MKRSERTGNGPRRPVLFAGVAAGGSVSAGGAGPAPIANAAVHLEPTRRFGASLVGTFPLGTHAVSADVGTAKVSEFGASGIARLAIVPTDRTVSLQLGAGGGARVLSTVGRARDLSAESSSRTVVVAEGLLGVSLLVRLATFVRLRAEGFAEVFVPRPTVVFEGHTEATFGRPAGTVSLGLDLGLVGVGGDS